LSPGYIIRKAGLKKRDIAMPEDPSESRLVRLLAIPFLIALGLAFALGAFWPAWRGWIERGIGAFNFIYLGVGFLFFYTAVLVAEKNLMRKKFLGLMEEIMDFFYGKGHRKLCDAVEILIGALRQGDEKTSRTAAAELKRLTGQDFGPHHERWNAWWIENRERFLLERRNDSPIQERETHGSSK
jgi:hypothetical protein